MTVDNKNIVCRTPFSWYGGKTNHLKFILPNLPKCKHFVDVFGGGASVILAREPSLIETYNDLDSEVVNFFKVLRDNRSELIEKLELTPYSREEYKLSLGDQLDDVERARRFFVKAASAYSGCYATSSWAYSKNDTRGGRADRVARFQLGVSRLDDIANRLMEVQIENDDGIKIIERYDSPKTLFYCDPPYLHDTRTNSHVYKVECNRQYHKELAATLCNIEGKAAISGYSSELYDEIYAGWSKVIDTPNNRCSSRCIRQEVLWANYNTSHDKIGSTVKQYRLPEFEGGGGQ